MGSRRYYTVWEGRAPGVYDTWEECKDQVEGFPGARYKAFSSKLEAVEAFRTGAGNELDLIRAIGRRQAKVVSYDRFPEIRLDAIAVDAGCSRNPGPVEYQGVMVGTGERIFHVGPLEGGTNNIGEYLAIIHAAALLAQRGDTTTPIYSDSRTAQSWVRRGGNRSTMTANGRNGYVMELLRRADQWLSRHTIPNPILKWDTENWGEIPADFGRK